MVSRERYRCGCAGGCAIPTRNGRERPSSAGVTPRRRLASSASSARRILTGPSSPRASFSTVPVARSGCAVDTTLKLWPRTQRHRTATAMSFSQAGRVTELAITAQSVAVRCGNPTCRRKGRPFRCVSKSNPPRLGPTSADCAFPLKLTWPRLHGVISWNAVYGRHARWPRRRTLEAGG